MIERILKTVLLFFLILFTDAFSMEPSNEITKISDVVKIPQHIFPLIDRTLEFIYKNRNKYDLSVLPQELRSELENEKELDLELADKKDCITCISFSNSRRNVVAGTRNGSLNVFDIITKKCIASLDVFRDEELQRDREVTSVAYSVNDKYLACASFGGKIKIWNLSKRDDESNSITISANSAIFCISFSHDERFIVSGGWDGHIKVWSFDEGLKNFTCTKSDIGCEGNHISTVQFSIDDKVIHASSIYSEFITVWDWTNIYLEAVLFDVFMNKSSLNRVYSAQIDHFDKYVYVATTDKVISIWDKLECIYTINYGPETYLSSFEVSPSGKYTACILDNKVLKMWDLTKEISKCMHCISFDTTIDKLAFSSDERYIAISLDNKVKILDFLYIKENWGNEIPTT